MITLRRYGAGEIILKENDPGETAFVIEQGRVEVSKELNGEKVHLARLGFNETFGEMSMIDDKPRSATVTALEDTVVREVHRDEFLQNLKTDPEISITILKVLFERLRECHVKILQLKQAGSPPHDIPLAGPDHLPDTSVLLVSLEGLTPVASQGLPEQPFYIKKFPFRIGRKSSDPLSHNDLMIPDTVPFQISRHHLELIIHEGRIGAVDRGSYLGSIVDGKELGGPDGGPGPLFFDGDQGILILGTVKSPFRYRIVKQP
jgi:hypothetical protein